MGFEFKTASEQPIRYLNPYFNSLRDKRVIIYGAGVVGKDYYRLHLKTREFVLVSWVDVKWKKLQENNEEVMPVESILD